MLERFGLQEVMGAPSLRSKGWIAGCIAFQATENALIIAADADGGARARVELVAQSIADEVER